MEPDGRSETICQEALRIARTVGARQAEVRALNALGVLRAYRGEFDEGIALSREAVAIAEDLGAADDLATAYIDLAHVLGLSGRYDDAVEASRVGYEAMNRVGLARQDGSFLLANAAESLIKAGRWAEADELVTQARASEARGIRAFRSSSTKPGCGCARRLRPRRGVCRTGSRAVHGVRRAGRMAPRTHEVAAEPWSLTDVPPRPLDRPGRGSS